MKGPGRVYLEVRTKTLLSHLLTPKAIRDLIEIDDLESTLAYLLKTDYTEEISKVMHNPEPRILENIFYRKAVQRYEEYSMIIETVAIRKPVRDMILNYMARLEVENLKRIIRALHSNRTVSKDALIPVTRRISRINFEILRGARSIYEFIDLIKETPYSKVSEYMKFYLKHGIPLILESKIEQIYYERILNLDFRFVDVKPALEMIGTEIDLKNIWFVLQLANIEAGREVGAEALINYAHKIDTGKLVKAIRDEGYSKAIERLERSKYSNLVKELKELIMEGKADYGYGLLLKELGKACLENLKGIGIPIGYLLLVDLESKNLAKIITGKYLKMMKRDLAYYTSV